MLRSLWLRFCFSDISQYDAMYLRSINDPDGFWSEIASEFYWEKMWPQENGKVHSENFDIREGPIKVEVILSFMHTLLLNLQVFLLE